MDYDNDAFVLSITFWLNERRTETPASENRANNSIEE
jgi:hypothetical protein